MHLFRNLLISLAMATGVACQAFAIPAYPGKMLHKQADGKTVTIYMRGDEFGHMFLSEDGFPLVENGKGSLEYANESNGKLVPSGIIAQNIGDRSSEAKHFLAKVDKNELTTVAAQAMSNSIETARKTIADEQQRRAPRRAIGETRLRISDVPTTGKHKALIILVNFADRTFSEEDPTAYYDRFFHEKGFSENGATGSVYDFYHDGSNGAYDPDFVVVGPVTVSQPAAYYATGTQHMDRAWQMVREAAILADSLVDYKEFDTDGDGVCDNVYVFYAGYGYADTGGSQGDCIWPHSYYLDINGNDHSVRLDSIKINRYTASQELNGTIARTTPEGIGTFCHEFGHVLGIPDLYATNYSSNGADKWSVMAMGSYNNNSCTPPTFSSYERYELGWIDPVELNAGSDTITRLPNLLDTNFAYKISVPGKSNEYFLLENRQQKGWDEYLPYHGMLVWHIQEDQNRWARNQVNSTTNHQCVDINEATANGDLKNAPYPGASNKTAKSFTDWSGKKVFGLVGISERDSIINMLRDDSNYRLQAPQLTVSDIKGLSAEANWTRSALKLSASDAGQDVDGYDFFLTDANNHVIAKATDTKELSYSLTGLEPEHNYTANVVAKLQGLRSDTTSVAFSTTERQIEETKVHAIAASDVTTTAFTANWEPVKNAKSYAVSLYTRTDAGRAQYGTGFDDYNGKASDLPEGWSASNLIYPITRYYGNSSPSFSLRNDSAWLEITKPGSKLQALRFWHRSSDSENKLIIQEYVDGAWQQVGDTLQTARNLKSISSFNLDNADKVRIMLRRDAGEVLLDDVYATYSYETYVPVDTVNIDASQLAGDSIYSYTFSDLDTDKLYGYSVKALTEDGRTSQESDMIQVPGNVVPSAISFISTDTKKGAADVYNLQGQKVARIDENGNTDKSLPVGIYIVNGKKVVIKK